MTACAGLAQPMGALPVATWIATSFEPATRKYETSIPS
jgi:hypothetical protein